MAAKFTKDTIAERRDEVVAEIEAIEQVTLAKREARDKLINDHEKTVAELNAELRELEKPLFDLKNEHATLSRALGGRSLNVR